MRTISFLRMFTMWTRVDLQLNPPRRLSPSSIHLPLYDFKLNMVDKNGYLLWSVFYRWHRSLLWSYSRVLLSVSQRFTDCRFKCYHQFTSNGTDNGGMGIFLLQMKAGVTVFQRPVSG